MTGPSESSATYQIKYHLTYRILFNLCISKKDILIHPLIWISYKINILIHPLFQEVNIHYLFRIPFRQSILNIININSCKINNNTNNNNVNLINSMIFLMFACKIRLRQNNVFISQRQSQYNLFCVNPPLIVTIISR